LESLNWRHNPAPSWPYRCCTASTFVGSYLGFPSLPFGDGLDLRRIEPVAAWVEPYAALYEDYRSRLDAVAARTW
jgi:hypothetical protein